MIHQIVAGLLLAGSTLASPTVTQDLTLAKRVLWERQDAGSCRNQSCEVATISGSTGRTTYPYNTYPTGDNQDGDCCIVRYFPIVKPYIYEYRPGLQQYCASHGGDAPKDSNPPGVNSISVPSPPPNPSSTTTSAGLFPGFPNIFGRQIGSSSCKPNILVYVKGTFEFGDLGQTQGPAIQSALGTDNWSVVGVEYDNSIDNDYCLGLPGGINARQVLEQQVANCPNSNFAMAGYSQGAMVVRHALARAQASAVAKVKSVLTYGDPFIGAPIGQYNGPIHVFCAQGDGVCNGQLDIGLFHLSYGGEVDEGVALIKQDLGA